MIAVKVVVFVVVVVVVVTCSTTFFHFKIARFDMNHISDVYDTFYEFS